MNKSDTHKETQIKYWLFIVVFCLASTYLNHALVKPFWGTSPKNNTFVTSLEALTTIFFLPICLSLFNFLMAKRYALNYRFFILNTVLVLFCIWLSAYFHFENWANYTGLKSNPDEATIEVDGFTKLAGYCISLICMSIAFASLKHQNT
ncbi:hypothetical protein [Flavobacterium sp. WV_118_3]|uniref:hypothetical protein n=1 Tax=Flavobacterium sp. WV_118_3 TaxID=3151764 RepID=UPI00321A72C4